LSPDSRQLRHSINRVFGRVVLLFFGLALAAGVLVPSHGAHAAIKFGQSKFDNPGNPDSSITFDSNNTAGDLIVLALDWTPQSVTVTNITDTNGNTYVSAVGPVNGTGGLGSWRDQVFYAKNIGGGANTITVHFSGALSESELYAHEYSGADKYSPLDVTASSVGNSATPDSGSKTTNFPKELVFGYSQCLSNPCTQGIGFASRNTGAGNLSEDMIATSTGSYSASAFHSSGDWVMSMATFKAAGSGIQVSSRSDVLSDPRQSATSNHTVAFKVNNAIYGSSLSGSSTLVLTLPSDFTIPVGMDCGDVDAATSVQFSFNYPGCVATATAWGFSAMGSSITLVPPSGTGVYVPTSTQVTIKIGSNATVGQQGAHWITNPSTGGVYTISVGGTFDGSGNMLVSINSGVTVQATVAESLSFTVSSVGSSAFPATGILDNFNRANEDPLANGNWTCPAQTSAGNLTLTSNQTNSNFGSADCYWSSSTFGPDSEAFVTISTVNNGFCTALFLRTNNLNSASLNGYWYEHCAVTGASNDTFTIYRIDNGSFTSIAAGTQEVSSGDRIGAEAIGSSLKMYYKAAAGSWVQVVSVTDSTYSGSGRIGLHLEDTTERADDFGGGTVSRCVADDGATVNSVTSTATSVPFGTISPNAFYQGCQDLIVSTNAGNGYSVTVQESSVMRTVDGRLSIPDTTCDGGTCSESAGAAWTNATKNGLGHTCFNQLNHDCNASYSSGTNFRQAANLAAGETAQSVMSSSTAATATGRVKYRLSTSAAQSAGIYTTIISYTIYATY
jgi:hypothetical protein